MRIDVQNLADLFDCQEPIVFRALDRCRDLFSDDLTNFVKEGLKRIFYRVAHLTRVQLKSKFICLFLNSATLIPLGLHLRSGALRYSIRNGSNSGTLDESPITSAIS